MKDSRIEWIGEVPEDWEISTIGAHYAERTDKVSDLDYGPLSVTKSGIVPQLEIAAKSSNHDNRKLVLKDDFVINSRSDRKMSAGISNMDGSVSVINTVLYSNTIDRNYTKYLLKNYAFAEEFYRWGTGIVDDLWSTKWLKMKNIPIPVPPIEKQKKIGEVIDNMFQNTNNIINETEQSIKELKKYKQSLITESVTKGLDPNVEMKDSGIEPMMNVPKHWKINKIKYLFELYRGLNITKKNLIDTGIPVINYGEIHSKYGFHFDLRYDVVQKVDSHYLEYKNSLINQGDFIFADTSEDIEGSGNFTCYLNEEMCFAGSHTIILKPKKFINYFYFSYLFESLLFRSQIQKKVEGIKVYSITQRILKSLILFEPPAKEQEQIVQYLDNKISTIDRLIEDKTKVIAELENYKTSLIYEYSTGKKEV